MTDVTLGRHKATRLGNITLRLALREDGLDWIAEGRPEWHHQDGSLRIAALATAAGLHRQALSRVVTDPTRYPKNETIAAIATLGMKARKVTYKTALDRIFQVIDLTDVQCQDCVEVAA